MTSRLTTEIVNAQAQIISDALDGGTMKIYSGTQPLTANTGVSGDATLLATLNFGSPAFASISQGVMTANPLTGGVATSDGIATWFRLYKADGVTAVLDGNVSTTQGNLVLPTTTITTGITIEITNYTHTVVKNHSYGQ